MSSSRWLVAVIVAVSCWTAALAQADANLDRLLTQLLQSEDDRQVAEARRDIVNLLRDLNAPAATLQARNDRVLAALPAVFQGNHREVVRLNATLVAAVVQDPRAVPLLDRALQDSHEAVRLRAAKGLAALAERIRSANLAGEAAWSEAIGRMLDVVQSTLERESSQRVLYDVFAALAELIDIDARRAMPAAMKLLHDRATARLDTPTARMQSEYDCLQKVYRHLIQAQAGANHADLRQLAIVSSRYLTMTARVREADEQRGELGPHNQREYQQMVLLADTVCGWATQQLAPRTPEQPPLTPPIAVNTLRLRAQARQAALQASPVSVPAAELELGN